MKQLHNLLRSENGATAIEYSLIASLVSVVIIGALNALGTGISGLYGTITSAMK